MRKPIFILLATLAVASLGAQTVAPVAGVFSLNTGSGGGGGSGTVTNVSWTGGIVSVANPTTTPEFTIAGASGGIPYFTSASTWDSSLLLTQSALMVGGGDGGAPSTPSNTTTLDSSGNIVTQGSLTTGAGGSVAGFVALGQGSAPSTGTTNITLYAPVAVTSYRIALPGTAATGLYLGTNSAGTVTVTQVAAPTGTIVGTSDAQTLTNKILDFATSLSTDDTYIGTTRSGRNNSGGVTQWDAVYLNGSSQWVLADANGSSTYPCRGLAVATATTGNATTVITRGTVRNDAWAWTPGGNIYLSTTPGGLTQTAPATTGDKVQVIGYALDADTMAVEIGTDYGTAP